MSDVLARICKAKREHIARSLAECSLREVEALARAASPPRGFALKLREAINSGQYGLIAEIKKASPSKGLIRSNFNPGALAKAYEEGGACCISVLTDTPYFQGADDDLILARKSTVLPVLRKDFMLDPYQVIETRALGGDCILLIMAALDDSHASELMAAARDWAMDVLVEVHDNEEMNRALKLESDLIGINNRNLKTLEVDISMTERLAPMAPGHCILVSESGLYTPTDLARMASVGARCFLVGESLMRQEDVQIATTNLLTRSELESPS
ncbi:MAG: indole-3-glycerol-phosphate synthase [Magnetovibrio sp.]|nr:indole-3-glycerol-phosphate synthase [Magnetovibrio sp.]